MACGVSPSCRRKLRRPRKTNWRSGGNARCSAWQDKWPFQERGSTEPAVACNACNCMLGLAQQTNYPLNQCKSLEALSRTLRAPAAIQLVGIGVRHLFLCRFIGEFSIATEHNRTHRFVRCRLVGWL